MNLNSTTQRIAAVTTGAALILVVIWYFAFWSPQSHALSKAHAAHSAAEAKISQLDTQISGLKTLEKEIPADKQKLASFTTSVPDNPQLAAALDQIQATAAATHVILSSIVPSAAPVKSKSSSGQQYNGVPAISVTMSAAGSYPQVMSFLTALDNMPRTLVVTNLSLSASGSGPSAGLSAAISSNIFYAGQPTP